MEARNTKLFTASVVLSVSSDYNPNRAFTTKAPVKLSGWYRLWCSVGRLDKTKALFLPGRGPAHPYAIMQIIQK